MKAFQGFFFKAVLSAAFLSCAAVVCVAQTTDNQVCVVRTDGVVDQIAGKPAIRFSGSQIRVGTTSYDLAKVQRILFGSGVKGVINDADYSKEEQRAVYVYRNDGGFEAFLQSNVKRISIDKADTMRVSTPDSLYKIPVAAIDSIGLHAFETVYNPKVINLAPYEPYVEAVSVASQTIRFSRKLPAEMKPKTGDILFFETFNETFPEGYAGRVKTTDGYSCTTEIVGLDDIYERVLLYTEFCPVNTPEDAVAFNDMITKNFHGPAPMVPESPGSNNSVSFDLSNLKLTASFGGVSVSAGVNLVPQFNMGVVKRDSDEKTMVKIDVKLVTTSSLGVSVSGGGDVNNHKGRSITPMAMFVIPACPIFAVGIDLFPSLSASIKGTVKVEAAVSSTASASFSYCDGDVSFKPRISFEASGGVPKAEAEGTVFAGFTILPSIQITGGICKLGPVFEIGPSATLTLEVDAGGAVVGLYDAIKDSKLSLSVGGEFSTGFLVTGKAVAPDLLPKLPFSKTIMDCYFVPLYTQPGVSPTRKENVGVSTSVSRTLLYPVPIGIDILYGSMPIKSYDHGEYQSGNDVMRGHFSGFEEGETYTAVPTVDIFGMHLLASPRTDFTIEEEEKEEEKPQTQNTGNLDRPEPPVTEQEFKAPGGYRFEWKDSNGDHGYFERKNDVYLAYHYSKHDGTGRTTRYNDKDQTYAWRDDESPLWWVEGGDEFGSSENVMEESHRRYQEYIDAVFETIQEADGLWNVFYDDLGGIAYFEETFRRHYRQSFGAKGGDDWLRKDFVGTGTICGIKCNIYDNHRRWPQQAKVWADPATGLCLRYELDGGQTWFEVTKFEVHNFDLRDLK